MVNVYLFNFFSVFFDYLVLFDLLRVFCPLRGLVQHFGADVSDRRVAEAVDLPDWHLLPL